MEELRPAGVGGWLLLFCLVLPLNMLIAFYITMLSQCWWPFMREHSSQSCCPIAFLVFLSVCNRRRHCGFRQRAHRVPRGRCAVL